MNKKILDVIKYIRILIYKSYTNYKISLLMNNLLLISSLHLPVLSIPLLFPVYVSLLIKTFFR